MINVDMQTVSQASLSLFCVTGGIGLFVLLVRDKTIQGLRKQVESLTKKLEEITIKRFDEAVEYADLVLESSKETEKLLAAKDKKIDELQTEVNNLRFRNKQLERGIK